MRNSESVNKREFFDSFPGENGKFIPKIRNLFVDLHKTLLEFVINLCDINNDVIVAIRKLTDSDSPLTPDQKRPFNEFILKNMDEVLKKILPWQFIQGENPFNSNDNPTEYFDDEKRQKIKELSATDCTFILGIIEDAQNQLNRVKSDDKLKKNIIKLKAKMSNPFVQSVILQLKLHDIYRGTFNTDTKYLFEMMTRSKYIVTIKSQVEKMEDAYNSVNLDKSVENLVNAIAPIVQSVDEKQHDLWKKITNCIENKICVQKKSSIFSFHKGTK